ncbi:unnamed protein product [Arctia plantaginis]|uniref:Fe2OG dioxygenase domain-containing protein n=1 Tax=Arctia plantaginis TaxID=874455 RepID=A0A8S1ASH2_ARCPL|nr:unnamed protein product [Arctia plantaginis]
MLGRTLFKDKDFEMAILWMKQAYRKYNEDNVPYRFTDINILEYISYGYYQQGETQKGLQWTQKILNIEPDHKKAKQSLKGYIKRLTKKIINPSLGSRIEERENPSMADDDYKKTMLEENYEDLCRGDIDLSVQVISRLTCRYVTETHPFLKIAPIKMEMKYLDPEVVLYHELLNDREIELIKRFAMPRLELAKVTKSNNDLVHDSRVSKIAWFVDSQLEVLQRISDRISHFTGLSMKINQSRNMQICNYGIGGHFLPHVDPPYMTDVPRGGATVFPRIGLRIPPTKGTALVWFNLHSSGEVNQATLHGACPVLLGSKWVCTKWIYQAGQELRKPCNRKYQPEGYDMTAVPPPVLKISRSVV